jgi:glutathione S-transferase
MADLTLTTYDWVPEAPRGFVRDIRVRWALEEAADTGDTPGWKRLDDFLKARLRHLEPVLAAREWLAGSFSVADILMADVLRLVDRFEGLAGYSACRDYVVRATARPSFVKAHADQIAHFAAAD